MRRGESLRSGSANPYSRWLHMVTDKGIDRVPERRADVTRRRLREVRDDCSLRRTVKLVSAAASELKIPGRYTYVDVARFEGSDKSRSPRPPVDYVRAFARAFASRRFALAKEMSEPELLEYLLAEDVFAWNPEDLKDWLEARDSLRAKHVRRHPRTAADRRRDTLRDRVAYVLVESARIPLVQRGATEMPRDTIAWIIDDLERLFWEAFYRPDADETELLELAWGFGRLIPTPPRLSKRGFLRYSEIEEARLRRWWIHQSEALRCLLRPTDFSPDVMNLGRFGEGGYPLPWRDWMAKWDVERPVERQEVIRKARGIRSAEEEPTTTPE